MFPFRLPKAPPSVVQVGAIGLCLVLCALDPVEAQSREYSEFRSASGPSAGQQQTGHANQEGRSNRSAPAPGMGLPPAARPADPPSTLGRPSPAGPSGLRGKASPSSPTMPGDPTQTPVDGGLGWLAAAGAAYALRRLRMQTSGGEAEGEK